MKRILIVVTALFIVTMGWEDTPLLSAQEAGRPVIQVAILLDTSSSMSGLIDQARTRLWTIVNELAETKKGGVTPRLEVALFEYGNSNLSPESGYVKKVTSLTTDLDLVSETLHALTTTGGKEYCGTVIQQASRDLAWHPDPGSLKLVFIAGNEPFTQGNVDYRRSCRNATQRGIVVNTIFCGDHNEGIRTSWKEGATMTDGDYFSINHNRDIVHIQAPQDAELTRLSRELNETYIPYGEKGIQKKIRQEEQDTMAEKLSPSVSADRASAKSSTVYRNSEWDLVDAVRDGKVEVESMEDDELPEELSGMSSAERKTYVSRMQKKREAIQERIRTLSKEREAYIRSKRSESAERDTFDRAVLKSVRRQAVKKNFTLN
jgi:hypothetical protein